MTTEAPKPHWLNKRIGVGLIFAWYDLWVGAYWDRGKRRLYVLPLPCLGIVIDFRE